MDWRFTLDLLITLVAFFCGWQFALWVDPERFLVAGYVLGAIALGCLLLGAGTSKRGV